MATAKASAVILPLVLRCCFFTAVFLAYVSEAGAQELIPYASGNPYASGPDLATKLPGGFVAQAIGTESLYFDSNPLLQTTNVKSLWGSITSPELVLDDKTPTTTVTSDTVFTSNNFNRSDFDSNDVHSKLNLLDQGQRWGAGLQGNVDYDTTRTSEISTYNISQITPSRHFGGTVTPEVSYNFLPTDKLGLTGSYTSSHYDNSIFTNYEVMSASPSYAHNFDPLNTGTLSVQAQRYRALSGPSNTVDSIGPQVGWQTRFTQRFDGDLSVGFQDTRQTGANVTNSPWTIQYDFSGGLKYKDQKDTLTARASRSQYPFGNGTEAFVTQFTLEDIHTLNERFQVGAQGSYQSADYQSNASGNFKVLETGAASLTYHATDHLDVVASYQYQHETLIDVSSSVERHMGLISLSYKPKAWNL